MFDEDDLRPDDRGSAGARLDAFPAQGCLPLGLNEPTGESLMRWDRALVPSPHGRVVLGGCLVDLLDRAEVLRSISDRLTFSQGPPLIVASANLDHVHHFGSPVGRAFLSDNDRHAWLVLLDGMPMVWQAQRLTHERHERLAGADVISDVLQLAQSGRHRIAFLGGTRECHLKLGTILQQSYPGVDCSGFWSPTRAEIRDPSTSLRLAGEIQEAGTEILVVGLGKPTQEVWAARYGSTTGSRVILTFGAAADFVAGIAPRAASWMQKSGLEWLFRLTNEPRRLSRRYLVQGPRALTRVLAESHT